jgi:ABC-type antimicrobial peptide transport system permease subunit
MTFTLLAVTIVTVVAGLLPAWRVSRLEVASALRSGDGRGATAAGSRLQMTLVAVQAAIALVLAVTTVLLGRTFAQLQNTPLGFTANNLTVISLALPIDEFATGPERVSAFERLAARLATSAIGVAASTSPPLSSGAPVSVRPGASSIGTPLRISAQDVTVNFFETLRIRLVSGRSFDDRDRTDGAPVGILNEAAARLVFGDAADVVGRQIQIGNQQSREIVGVVANTQSAFYNSLEWRTDPIVFLPASQAFSALRDPTVRSFGLHLLIRTNRTVTMAEIKPVVASISNRIAVTAVTTAAAAVGEATRQPAFRMMLLGWFGAASLLLAAIGVYGVVAQLVAARRREIGIRLALGAGLPLLMRSLVSRVVTVGLIGTAGGALFIVSMRRSLAAVLYGVQPLDPRSFAVGVAVLLVLVAIAALVPALRIIAVKPTEALRAD